MSLLDCIIFTAPSLPLADVLERVASGMAFGLRWLTAIGIVTMCVGIALCLWRIVRGPTLADRALAADTISIQLIGLVILLTVRVGSPFLVDGMLVLALLGFAGSIAAAQFIARPHVQRQLDAELIRQREAEQREAESQPEPKEEPGA